MISALVLLLASLWGQQASAAPPTGAISGVVVDGQTLRPIPDAVVFLEVPSGSPTPAPPTSRRAQTTDSQGRFVFRYLPPDRYSLSAGKDGYFPGSYDVGASAQIALADRQWVANANITLNRPASLSGTVLDEFGQPAVGVDVRVFRQLKLGGQPQLADAGERKTDDRGIYRVSGLRPGRYYVAVLNVQSSVPAETTAAQLAGLSPDLARSFETSGRALPATDPTIHVGGGMDVSLRQPVHARPSPDGRARAYRSVYFPNAAAIPGATPLDLQFGVERAGIDLRLEAVPVFRVSGVVQGDPAALPSFPVRLVRADGGDGDPNGVATTIVGPGGRFTFVNVPAGSYTLVGRWAVARLTWQLDFSPDMRSSFRMPGAGGLFNYSNAGGISVTTHHSNRPGVLAVRWPVQVESRDVTDLVVPSEATSTLRGRIVRENDLSVGLNIVRAVPASGDLSLVVAPSVQPPGRADSDTFAFEGLSAGEYLIEYVTMGNSATVVRSVRWNGEDYTNRPLPVSAGQVVGDVVITVTGEKAELSGFVRDARGAAVAGASVLVFPVDRALWTNQGWTPERIKSTTTSRTGEYRHPKLPGGEYFAAVIGAGESDNSQDPAFLERLAATASRLTLQWGVPGKLDLVAR
jgi:hypothetical protein